MSNAQPSATIAPRDLSAAQMKETARSIERTPTTHFDALIIGAGFSGRYMLHMLHSLRDKLGLSARVLEAGARCDTPSYIYCFTFDRNQPLDGAHRAG